MSPATTPGPIPGLIPGLIIAVDGPAGAGKSTIACRLAQRFGLLNLESGAMYRAFALKAMRLSLDLDNGPQLEELAARTEITLEPGGENNRVFLDGEEVTAHLRQPAVSDGASRVSVYPGVRARMVHLQQQMGARGGVVMEGRDIGTVVFPHAPVKIFLEASAGERAQRRLQQQGSGEFNEILEQIRARDLRDRTRQDSPLLPAPDAVTLDSTGLSLDQVVAAAVAIVDRRLSGR